MESIEKIKSEVSVDSDAAYAALLITAMMTDRSPEDPETADTVIADIKRKKQCGLRQTRTRLGNMFRTA